MKTKQLLATMATLLIVGTAFPQANGYPIVDSIPFLDINLTMNMGCEVKRLMMQANGDVVSKTIRGDDILIHKVSTDPLEVVDSLCFPFPGTGLYGLLERDPRGQGNLYVVNEPDGMGGHNLRISRFTDGSLECDTTQDIVTHLCDHDLYYYSEGIIDCRGDIIWKYYEKPNDSTRIGHFARFGLDGTLKHDAVMQPNAVMISYGVFSEEPLRYFQWKKGEHLTLYVYDSLFNLENSYIIRKGFTDYPDNIVYFTFSYQTFERTFVIPDGDDVLVAASYEDMSSGPGWPNYANLEVGTAVARYDLRTMQQKNLVMFNDYPGGENGVINLGFFKSSAGSVYLVYKEQAWTWPQWVEVTLPITVVKMDEDLNVLWKRDVYFPKGFNIQGVDRCLMDEVDGKVKIVATGQMEHFFPQNYSRHLGLYYFFVTDDGTVGTNDMGIEVRPYAFYPNPAQDRLRLNYSPDVKPAQIELYDLQGRLVRSQGSGLESLSLQGLAPGQYVMKVTMADGTTFSDKVVKE